MNPQPGRHVHDPATGRSGVVQALHDREELLFDPEVTGARIAFLRPAAGGLEWPADAEALTPAPQPTPQPASEPMSGRQLP